VINRYFFCIPVQQESGLSLFLQLQQLCEISENIKWIRPDNYHITLAFLGKLDPEKTEQASMLIKQWRSSGKSLKVTALNPENFPNKNSHTLAMPLEASKELLGIHEQLGIQLEQRDIDGWRKTFRPHLTIGRINKNCPASKTGFTKPVRVNLDLDRLVLFNSESQPGGSVYHTVAEGLL
jgi:2'-5' RNA ligase